MIAGYKSSQYAYKIYLASNGQISWGRVGNGCLEMGIGGWRRVGKHGKFRRGRGAGAGGRAVASSRISGDLPNSGVFRK